MYFDKEKLEKLLNGDYFERKFHGIQGLGP